jgi:hypothetical protein
VGQNRTKFRAGSAAVAGRLPTAQTLDRVVRVLRSGGIELGFGQNLCRYCLRSRDKPRGAVWLIGAGINEADLPAGERARLPRMRNIPVVPLRNP